MCANADARARSNCLFSRLSSRRLHLRTRSHSTLAAKFPASSAHDATFHAGALLAAPVHLFSITDIDTTLKRSQEAAEQGSAEPLLPERASGGTN